MDPLWLLREGGEVLQVRVLYAKKCLTFYQIEGDGIRLILGDAADGERFDA
jgi:hypothetical protein